MSRISNNWDIIVAKAKVQNTYSYNLGWNDYIQGNKYNPERFELIYKNMSVSEYVNGWNDAEEEQHRQNTVNDIINLSQSEMPSA